MGTCVRIMTGAPVPAGCDAVVMQEETEQTADGVRFTASVKAGQNIRRTGEDIALGATVFAAGQKLTVGELPVLASLGIADIEVIRQVRVALFLPVTNCSFRASRCRTGRFTTPTVWRYT